MLVREVMSSAPITCTPDDTLERVAKLMAEHDCGFIPVCRGAELAGVVTDRDIACRAVARSHAPAETPVSEVMSSPVFTVRDTDDVQVAIDRMEQRQVRRLPVLDDGGRLAGVIAPSDLAPIFASMNVSDFLLAVSYWARRPAVEVS